MEQERARACLPLLDEAEQALAQQLENTAGAQIERKRFSIAVHYRNVAEDQIEAVDKVLGNHDRLYKKYGKKVYELQPAVAWDKEQALLWLLGKLKLNYPFDALEEQGLGVVVGTTETRHTYAEYRHKIPPQ